MKKIVVTIGLFLLVCNLLISQNITVKGGIYISSNERVNVKKKELKKVFSNIYVSDGFTIEKVNPDGGFTIQSRLGFSVFPILPLGWEVDSDLMIGNNNSLYLDSIKQNDAFAYHIPIRKYQLKEEVTIAAIGDVQIANQQELQYINASLMKDLLSRSNVNFNLFLGDLVNNNIDYFPQVKQQIESLPVKSFLVLGNHDRDIVDNFQDYSFSTYFGASNYVFNSNGVYYIILNNVYPDGPRGYKGKYSDEQLFFIEKILPLIDKKARIVLAHHIPLQYTSNKERMLDLLSEHNVLILSGHTHTVERFHYSPFIQELVVGATCGSWWTGEKDVYGLPSGLMQCGTPRGYFNINIKANGDYNFSFKGVGLDDNDQMSIWINRQDTLDTWIDELNDTDSYVAIANVYAGSDSTSVYYRLNGEGEWHSMQKEKLRDPAVARVSSLNHQKVYPTKHSRRAALRKRVSSHVWKALLPRSLKNGIHKIEIRAFDSYGLEVQGSRLFFVKTERE